MSKYPLHVLDTIRAATYDDLPEINSWLRARGIDGLKQDTVPPQGFIAPGIACGFMIRTNTGIGILEYFISNGEAPKAPRGQALERIAELLIAAGEGSGIRAFMAFTSSDSVKRLCTINGFECRPGIEFWLRRS